MDTLQKIAGYGAAFLFVPVVFATAQPAAADTYPIETFKVPMSRTVQRTYSINAMPISTTTVGTTYVTPRVVTSPVVVERKLTRPVVIEKRIEKPVVIQRRITRPVVIERNLSRPVVIQRTAPSLIVEPVTPMVIERPVFVEIVD